MSAELKARVLAKLDANQLRACVRFYDDRWRSPPRRHHDHAQERPDGGVLSAELAILMSGRYRNRVRQGSHSCVP